RDDVNGQPRAIGDRMEPFRVVHTTAGRDDAHRVGRTDVEHSSYGETGGLISSAAHRSGVVREIKTVYGGAAFAYVQRIALTTRVWLPQRNVCRIEPHLRAREQTLRPVEEQPTGVTRAAHRKQSGTNARNGPHAGHVAVLRDGGP